MWQEKLLRHQQCAGDPESSWSPGWRWWRCWCLQLRSVRDFSPSRRMWRSSSARQWLCPAGEIFLFSPNIFMLKQIKIFSVWRTWLVPCSGRRTTSDWEPWGLCQDMRGETTDHKNKTGQDCSNKVTKYVSVLAARNPPVRKKVEVFQGKNNNFVLKEREEKSHHFVLFRPQIIDHLDWACYDYQKPNTKKVMSQQS